MTARYICKKIITAYELEKEGQPGYGVIYEDGYQSWSPKEAFEAGYEIIGHTEHLQPFHERLLAEGTLLANNLGRLIDYLESGKTRELSVQHQNLLKLQQIQMISLLATLTERAELLKG